MAKGIGINDQFINESITLIGLKKEWMVFRVYQIYHQEKILTMMNRKFPDISESFARPSRYMLQGFNGMVLYVAHVWSILHTDVTYDKLFRSYIKKMALYKCYWSAYECPLRFQIMQTSCK